MSSNGVILQDYVPNAINNLTEEIWCAGAVIPAGKRVVIGHLRDGWLEVTFTMGPNQDIIGMALVPPSVVGVEQLPARGFGGMKPHGVAALQARSRHGVGDVPADLPEGWPESKSPGTGIYPYYIPAYQSAAMQPGVMRGVTSWGLKPGAKRGVTSWGLRGPGLGAAGASAFTMQAAEELDEHLTTNGCAGCDDYKSPLRQLAFKFKAACMTDPGISGQVSFNISTPLAMTAFGSGTDKALALVLGAKKTYNNGPCTDDNGACLGNLPQIAQVTPVALGPLITQVVNQVNDQIQQHQASPTATQIARQEALVNALVAATTGLFTALSAALAAATPVSNITPKPPAPPATTPPATKSIWPTIVIGGLIGTTILATGALIYTHARHA